MTGLACAALDSPAGPIASLAAWQQRIARAVGRAAARGARLVVLGEYLTAPLLALARDPATWTAPWIALAQELAQEHRLMLVAGTHLLRVGTTLRNRACIALPDGRVAFQDKLHPTPWEVAAGVVGHDRLAIISHARMRCAVLTCYDVEFPEAARAAVAAGADALLVPSWTDERAGFFRVRRCAAARAVENAVAVLHAPSVGGVAVPGFEHAVGRAAILTPCDRGFPADGIADAAKRGLACAELSARCLRRVRRAGAVRPFADRRALDAYRVEDAQFS